jgi:asparagine synthase (glutamine-hydrolysing)
MTPSVSRIIRRGVGYLSRPAIVRAVTRESLTYLGQDALIDLYDAVRDLEAKGVEGALIEAGCALGGSAIVMTDAKSPDRPLYVYDVFGMIPPPTAKDGPDVHRRYEVIRAGESKGLGGDTYYGYQPDLIGKVRQNFLRHGFDPETNHIHLVQGLFEDTLQGQGAVALAHLDCDWYRSVMTCLDRIEPRLVRGGRLVIDDYGSWSGCRKAVDDYFRDKQNRYAFVRKSRLHIVRR